MYVMYKNTIQRRCAPQASREAACNVGPDFRQVTNAKTASATGPGSLASLLFEKASDIYTMKTEPDNMILETKSTETLREKASA